MVLVEHTLLQTGAGRVFPAVFYPLSSLSIFCQIPTKRWLQPSLISHTTLSVAKLHVPHFSSIIWWLFQTGKSIRYRYTMINGYHPLRLIKLLMCKKTLGRPAGTGEFWRQTHLTLWDDSSCNESAAVICISNRLFIYSWIQKTTVSIGVGSRKTGSLNTTDPCTWTAIMTISRSPTISCRHIF